MMSAPAVPGGLCQPAAEPVLADWWGRHVWVEHADTRSSLGYSDGSVTTFAWGRVSLGARELARSILCHATANRELPEPLCGCFVHEVIAALPDPGFSLDRDDVLAWLARQRPPQS